MKKICIFGAGGFSKEIYAIVLRCGLQVDAFIDVYENKHYDNIPIKTIDYFSPIKHQAVIAVGHCFIKQKIVDKLKAFQNVEFPNIIDPKAIILHPKTIYLGKGNIIFPNSTLTANIVINKFNSFYCSTTITHDDIIGDFCQFSPGVNISGKNIIGNNVFFGANSSTIENLEICNNVTVGAGATVIRDITQSGTYIGTPATLITNRINHLVR